MTITSGFAGYNIGLFKVLYSILARGGRFFVVAILLKPLRRMDPGQDRKASGAVGSDRSWRADTGIYCRIENDLTEWPKYLGEVLCRLAGSGYARCMLDRSGYLIARSITQLATAGTALARCC